MVRVWLPRNPLRSLWQLKRLLDAGVNVTTNADDPPSFGGYLGEHYTAIANALGLRADDDTH